LAKQCRAALILIIRVSARPLKVISMPSVRRNVCARRSVSPIRESRAELEKKLAAGATATSEVLQIISRAAFGLQPVLESLLKNTFSRSLRSIASASRRSVRLVEA
jgi:hypothetical protein